VVRACKGVIQLYLISIEVIITHRHLIELCTGVVGEHRVEDSRLPLLPGLQLLQRTHLHLSPALFLQLDIEAPTLLLHQHGVDRADGPVASIEDLLDD